MPDPLLERPPPSAGCGWSPTPAPGTARSTRRADGATTATVADDAADVAAILDHLGLGEFVTLGWSGGGPRALACAAMLPDRCLRRGVRASASRRPREYDGDLPTGMGEENVAEFAAAMAGSPRR